MPSKISFFNAGVFKKNVSRFMPLWLSYTLIWALILTLPLFSALRWRTANYSGVDIMQYIGRQILDISRIGGVMMGVTFGVMAAMAVWSYLYTAKSAGLFASLPISREGLFVTNYLSGLICLTVGNVIVFLLTLAVEALYGYVEILYLLQWLANVSMITAFFYSFATILAMVTGHILALPLLYLILNFTAVVIETIIRDLIIPSFLYGFNSYHSSSMISEWLSPIVFIISYTNIYGIYSADGNTILSYTMSGQGAIVAYFAAGILLSLISLFMYKRRRIESAGDVIAVHHLRPVFKYIFSAGCALCIGTLIYATFYYSYSSFSNPKTAMAVTICMLIGGLLGYYVAEMFLKKKFRVWREGLKGAMVVAAAIVLVSVTLEFDVFGIERKRPNPDDVDFFRISAQGYDSQLYERENIEEMLALHGSLIDHKHEYENTRASSISLYLDYYDMTDDGQVSIMSRVYRIPWEGDGYYTDAESDYRVLERLFNTEEATEFRRHVPIPVTADTITGCRIDYWDPKQEEYIGIDIGSVKGADLYNNCIVPDRSSSKLDYAWLVRDEQYLNSVYSATINMEILEKFYEDGEERHRWHNISIEPPIDALRTISFFRNELDIDLVLKSETDEGKGYAPAAQAYYKY